MTNPAQNGRVVTFRPTMGRFVATFTDSPNYRATPVPAVRRSTAAQPSRASRGSEAGLAASC